MFKLVTTKEVKKAYINERKYKIDFDFTLPVEVDNKIVRRFDRPNEFVDISNNYFINRAGSTLRYIKGKPKILDRVNINLRGFNESLATHFYRAFIGDIPEGFRLSSGVCRDIDGGITLLPELMYLINNADLKLDDVDDSKVTLGDRGLLFDKDDTEVVLELVDGNKVYVTRNGKVRTDRSKTNLNGDNRSIRSLVRNGRSNLVNIGDGYVSTNLNNVLYKAFVDPSISLHTSLIIPKNGYPNDLRIDNLMSLGNTRKSGYSYTTYICEILRSKPGYSIKARQVNENQYAVSYSKADYPTLEITNLNGDYLIGGLDDLTANYTAMCQLREACVIGNSLKNRRRHAMLQHLHAYLCL